MCRLLPLAALMLMALACKRAPTAMRAPAANAAHAQQPLRGPATPAAPAALAAPALSAAPAASANAQFAPISLPLGSVLNGSLKYGAALPLAGLGFRYNSQKRPEARYGTQALIGALVSSAAHVAQTLPGAELTISELSLEHGGPSKGHSSHQNGRDVDVLFYLLDKHGQPRAGHLIPLDPQGRGTDYLDLSDPKDDIPVALDVARSWQFIAALLQDSRVRVQRVFIAEHLRALLAEYAAPRAPRALLEMFTEVACQPQFPHDDHLHIRIYCDPAQISAGCLDSAPLSQRQRLWLAAQGTEAHLANPPEHPAAEITSEAEARARAGKLHPSVSEFLERRKHWLSQGRKTGGCSTSARD